MEIFIIIGIVIGIIFLWTIYDSWWGGIQRDRQDKENALIKLENLSDEVNSLISSKAEIEKRIREIDIRKNNLANLQRQFNLDSERENKRLEGFRSDLNDLVRQRSQGFPLLGEVYKEYFEIKGKILEEALINKKSPAPTAAEAVKQIKKEKKELVVELKALKYKLKNYEVLAPFLTDIEEEVPSTEDEWLLRDYSEEESQDEVTKFLTKEEYRSLTVAERNQRALDRYWDRSHKTLWTIGKMYEHYVGYLYEKDGWQVEYFGIKQRYEDFGRDLIAKKGKQCHIIQCKRWSKYKTVYENHLFQLFGTTFEFQKMNPKLKVEAVFYTTTNMSENAREFSKRLEMIVNENFKLDRYPCIKCNINKGNNEKIYHLPFDQQYDNVLIEPKNGEFYCMTVSEAEKAGFRRAFKWHATSGT